MNWKTIIAEIQEYGDLTQVEIAEMCETRQSTISSLVRGATLEPSFPLGKTLLDLHKKYERKAKREAV